MTLPGGVAPLGRLKDSEVTGAAEREASALKKIAELPTRAPVAAATAAAAGVHWNCLQRGPV